MRKTYLFTFVSLTLALGMLLIACNDGDNGGNENAADVVVYNAKIYTSDADNLWVEALAVKDGRFVYVGDGKGAYEYIGGDTQLIDAEGRWITPGFVDNHCHVVWMGSLFALMASLYGLESLDEMIAEILSWAEQNPNLPFVMAIGWTLAQVPGGGLPTAAMADEILADRPLILWGEGGHAGWLNTLALNLLQERNETAFEMLVPERDGEGNQTGFLNHFYKFNPFDYFTQDEIGVEGMEMMAYAVSVVLDDALKMGVTTMNDIQIYKTFLPFIEQFQQAGIFDRTRIRLAYFIEPSFLDDEEQLIEDLTAWQDWGAGISNEHLVAGESVKLYIDGVLGNHTSFLLEPYTDAPGNYGEPEWSAENFDRVALLADGMGLQMCTHSTGDAGTRRIIDSYSRATDENGSWDARHSIEHCEMIQPEDMTRMAEYEIYASMQPSHFYGIDQVAVDALGEERAAASMPWHSLIDAGVNVSFGSDWVAAPINPFYSLIIAALRMNSFGEFDWHPEEAVDLYDGITHYTLDSAKVLKMENEVGSIEVGKMADFVMFSIDLSQITSEEFLTEYGFEIGSLDEFVSLTAIGGEIVYEATE